MAEQSSAKIQFISRVASIPLVNSAIDMANGGYNRIKSSNKLVGSTLDIGERSLNYVVETTKPVVSSFERPINFADNLACQGLDKLEDAVPIIKDKPEELVKRYEDLKKSGIDRVYSLKDYGYEKVNNVLATSYGKTVASTVDSAIMMTENAVDRFLPASDDEPSDDQTNRNVIHRVGIISDKMRRRMYKQAMSNLGAVQKRSQEALNKMKYSVDLIGIAKNFDPLTAVKNPTMWFWDELTKDEPQDPSKPQTLDKRVLNYARRATKEVIIRFEELKELGRNLPATARKTIDFSLNYAKEIYGNLMKAKSVKDVSDIFLDQLSSGIRIMQTVLDNTIFPVVNRLLKNEKKD